MLEEKISVKRLSETAKIPSKGSEHSAGCDLYADLQEPVTIGVGDTEKIGTGLAIEIPEGYFGAIFARSGLATNKGIRPANCVGVCDSDYTGEYIVACHNDSDKSYTIYPGDRIAQLVIIPYLSPVFVDVEDISNTERGAGGFGSTGR